MLEFARAALARFVRFVVLVCDANSDSTRSYAQHVLPQNMTLGDKGTTACRFNFKPGVWFIFVFWEGLWEENVAKFTKKQVNQEAVIGGQVCRIDEAEEPSDVLWENLDTSIFQRCAAAGVLRYGGLVSAGLHCFTVLRGEVVCCFVLALLLQLRGVDMSSALIFVPGVSQCMCCVCDCSCDILLPSLKATTWSADHFFSSKPAVGSTPLRSPAHAS